MLTGLTLTTFLELLINSTDWDQAHQVLHFLSTQLSKNTSNNHFVSIAIALVAVAAVAIPLLRKRKQKGCLDPKEYKEFKLVSRTKVSHNTDRFRFGLPTPTSVLGLPIGQYIRCRGRDSEGQEVVRPYTPITLDSDVGYFELVVKMYPQGRMSHHFRQMREGDSLSVTGPVGKFRYRPGQARAFGMLTGGTGITPMFQLARAILENPKDRTEIHLIFANHTVDDILLKDELDGFAVTYPDRFNVYYVVAEPSKNWNGGVGHISSEMIQKHLPQPASDIMILRCGPPGMNKAMGAYLTELGYTQNMQFEF